jgi:hypothetical protein
MGENMNEPVAWILADKENEYIRSVMIVKHDIVPKDCIEIPLYTHPAKTLTDEEITYLAKRFEGVWSGEVDYKGFARAILRKAQNGYSN